jgi:hypothetical protein
LIDEYEELVINEINTEESAERFAKYLKKKRTYFLDGKWGSGKTEFIKKANSYLDGHNIIFVELWRTTDNRSVIEIIFARLHPFKYWLMKYLVFFLIALSILCSDKVNLGLASGHVFLVTVVKILIWSATSVVVLFQFFKRTSDDIYIVLLNRTLINKIVNYVSKYNIINYGLNLKNKIMTYALKNKIFKKIFGKKILVVDDFDRVKPENQEEAYKIFNILNGKLPVLFVGDYEKLIKNEDNYLQKIIDQKISLPYKLHSSEITNGINLPYSIKQIFTDENRVIRELVHFVDSVNQELKKKAGHVQIEQQLLIIYTYLFHPNVYLALKNGWRPSPQDKIKEGEKFIQATLSDVLEENGYSPKGFSISPENYFVYESATNLSISELTEIFLNDEKLSEHLNQKNEYDKTYEEVSFFIKSISQSTWKQHAERVEKLAIIQIQNRINPNQLTKYVFQQKLNLLESVLEEGRRYMDTGAGGENEFVEYLKEIGLEPRKDMPDGTFGGRQDIGKHNTPFMLKKIDDLFDTVGLDTSQRIYFYHKFLNIWGNSTFENGSIIRHIPRINDEAISSHISENIHRLFETGEYVTQQFPEQVLIAKLGFDFYNIDKNTLKELKAPIMDLSDEEFKYFWIYYEVEPIKDEQVIILKSGSMINFDKEFHDSVLERLKIINGI